MTRDEVVGRMATAMADWARRNEPLRLTPQTFREMAGAALDASTLLSTYYAVPTPTPTDEREGSPTP